MTSAVYLSDKDTMTTEEYVKTHTNIYDSYSEMVERKERRSVYGSIMKTAL